LPTSSRSVRSRARGGRGKGIGGDGHRAEAALGDAITDGLVVVKDGYRTATRRVRLVEAGHPVPRRRRGGGPTDRAMAETAGADDLLLVLVSVAARP